MRINPCQGSCAMACISNIRLDRPSDSGITKDTRQRGRSGLGREIRLCQK